MLQNQFVDHYRSVRNRINAAGHAFEREQRKRLAINIEAEKERERISEIDKRIAEMAETVPAIVKRKPKWTHILADVANRTGVTVEAICGTSRSRHIVKARHEAMYLLKTQTDLSFPQIAEKIGGRDHTTVIYGFRMWSESIAKGAAQ